MLAAGVAAVAASVAGRAVASASTAPHVLVVMLENKGYAATLGSCGAATPDPYLCSLASSYTSADAWFGVGHPSLPNYAAIVSGSTQGITTDCQPAGCGNLPASELGGQLTAAGIPWVGWMESMPSACDTGGDSGSYEAHHNPFAYFTDVTAAPNCATAMAPYPGSSAAVSVLDGASPPDFVWITPNVCDDMHSCPVSTGDAWLQANIQPILNSAWFADNGTVIITMDETDKESTGSCCGDAAGGQVPLVVVSSAASGKGTVALTGDHYGTLRTLEEAYGLPLLGAAANATDGDYSALLGGGGGPTPTPTGTPVPGTTPTPTPTVTPGPSVKKFAMTPKPIAPAEKLHGGDTVTIKLTAISSADGSAMPGATVFLAFDPAAGGGAASVGATALGATPIEFTTSSSGTLEIVYTAPSVSPHIEGSDVVVASDAASNPSVVSTDSFSL